MFYLIRNSISSSYYLTHASRNFSCTSASYLKRYREQRGLPVNRNAEGFLTDGPDYTFLDGRPTPLLHKQKLRMLKQREFASKIVELSAELDFAIERDRDIKRVQEDERQKILGDRLKSKGFKLLKKK